LLIADADNEAFMERFVVGDYRLVRRPRAHPVGAMLTKPQVASQDDADTVLDRPTSVEIQREAQSVLTGAALEHVWPTNSD
jgi:hypothetical protein